MTYSASDFTDTILDALGHGDVPEHCANSQSDMADACLHEIGRLQLIETAVRKFLPWFKEFIGTDAYAELVAGGGGVVGALQAALESSEFEWPEDESESVEDEEEEEEGGERCPDCGAAGERAGHQTCQYPRNHA